MIIVVFRTFVVYVLLIASIRLMGKRQIGELQPSELVTTILISNIASLPIEETDLPIVAAITPILLIVCFEIILSIVEIKNSKLSRVISGSHKIIIKDGQIVESVLKELRFSINDLLEALRNKDVFDIREVDYGIIETNGKLNIYKKYPFQEVTKEDMNIQEDRQLRPPVPVIIDGELQQGSLSFCNKDERWLQAKLRELHLEQREVLLLQCDQTDEVHCEIRSRA